MYSKQYVIENNLDEIKEKLSDNTPISEIARWLGVKYATLVRYLRRMDIPYATNQNRKGKPHYEARTSAMYYIENNIPIDAPKLRKKLLDEGIKERVCERCHKSEWMGEPIPLELHHIDGNHYNNKLDNLMILCSNCHAQVHDYSKKSD